MNAMLRERILPVGMGHTTNCFLQIEGTNKAEPYMMSRKTSAYVKNSTNSQTIDDFLDIYVDFRQYWQCSFTGTT